MNLSCPACRYSREVPAGRIPPGTKRVACPKCGEKFQLPQPEPESPPEEVSPAMVPDLAPAASGTVTLACPHCNARRSLPREKVPQRMVQVTCRQCRQSFTFQGGRAPSREAVPGKDLHPVLVASSTPDSEPPPRYALSGLGELFGKSWRTFLKRFPVFIGISLLTFGLAGLGYFLLTGVTERLTRLAGGSPLVHASGSAVTIIFVMGVMTWINAAMTYAIVDEDLGVRQSLGYGLQRLGSFLWVSLLVWFMIAGGSLLLLIPGLVFSVWFLFAQFILAREDARGMDALLKSRAYVAGRGWPVFGRLLLGGLLVAGISVVLAPIPLLGSLVGLLLGFFLLVYYAEIQKQLAEIKGDISFDCSRGVKLRWLLAGCCGFVLAAGLGLTLGGLG